MTRPHAEQGSLAWVAHSIRNWLAEILLLATLLMSFAPMLANEPSDLSGHFSLTHVVLPILLFGVLVLALKLINDRRRLNSLSRHLGELNVSLQKRLTLRTRQLAETKSLLMFTLEASPIDIALINAETAEVYFINRRLLERLGQRLNIEKLLITELLVDEKESILLMNELEQFGRVDNWETRIAPGNPYWCSLSVKLVEYEGKRSHLLLGFDVSTHKELLAALEFQAYTDSMTGLFNRRGFFDRSTAALDVCKRYSAPFSVLMVDVDHFKRVNDNHGHAVGDEALCWVSRILRHTLREVDIIGRLGGEEFAVVLPHTDRQQALYTAERLRHIIAESVLTCHGISLKLTVSIGAASLSPETNSLHSLLGIADEALYQAKRSGRNRVQC